MIKVSQEYVYRVKLAQLSKPLTKQCVGASGELYAQPADIEVDLQQIYDKLYSYEKAEAESLIIKLPVPLGTKVFKLHKTCSGRNCQSLLTKQPLSTPCLYFDKGRCLRSPNASVVWRESLDPIQLPIDDIIVVDLMCFKRFYSQPISFDFSHIDAVNPLAPLDQQVFLSEEDMAGAISFAQEELRKQTSLRDEELPF